MTAISLRGVSKSYRSSSHGRERLKELLFGKKTLQHRALEFLNLEISKQEIVGIIGQNGAGKSTLLKLIAGTLKPTTGSVSIDGRLCALLELGSGFHPELDGYENVRLGGAVAGLSQQEISERMEGIIEFAGLSEAMDRPLKTFSSGMMARLAFSLMTSVDPDILILDETLSVGDGQFAKKSFDRIMSFKEQGKTILFCSHSMYQVQAICTRAIWIESGRIRMDGPPGEVIQNYNLFLSRKSGDGTSDQNLQSWTEAKDDTESWVNAPKILNVQVQVGGEAASLHRIEMGGSDVVVKTTIKGDPESPAPTLGIVIINGNGEPVTSTTSLIDGQRVQLDESGMATLALTFEKFSLMRGDYWIHVFLLCDRGIHIYDKARMVAQIIVDQPDGAIGLVALPRRWAALS